ncbi:MAG TPA: MFS transporter [Symbiobacteriaceae bacterium]|nr:MFS transporter [Symbiobacteriaceae bacterium]
MERQPLRRNVSLIWLFRIVMALQFWMPISVIYLQSRGLTLTQIGLLESVGGLTIMLAEVPTGAVADLFGRRVSLTLGMLIMTLGLGLYAIADSFWLVAFSYIPWMIGYTLTSGADSALLYDSMKAIGEEQRYATIEGRNNTWEQGASAVAVASGGWLAIKFGLSIPIWLTLAVTALGAVLCLGLVEAPVQRTGKRSSGVAGQVRVAVSILFKQRILFLLMLFSALTAGMAFILKQSFFQVYAKAIDLPITLFGVLSFTMVLAGMAGSAFSGRLRTSGRRLGLLVPACLMGVAFLGLGIARNLTGISLLLIIPFLSSLLRPALLAAINQGVESEVRATVLSVNSLLWSVVLAVVSPVAGWLADRSLQSAFGTMGLTMLLVAPFIWWLVQPKRSLASVAQVANPPQ